MKQLSFLVVVSLLTLQTAFSQETAQKKVSKNFNEIKINSLALILGAAEVSFERTINEETSFGVDVLIPFDNEISGNLNYYISPFYRLYISNKYASGFFVEGFGMLNSRDYSLSLVNGTLLGSGGTDFALGVGIGGKFLTKSGFIGEINIGLGRNLFNEESDDLVGKLGVKLGYRF